MNALRKRLSRVLREIGVEERAPPGREDGFAGLKYGEHDVAHFHNDSEIDIRLGKDVIKREGLVRAPNSTIHAKRSKNSPWFELRISSSSDVDEALRLVRIAIRGLENR